MRLNICFIGAGNLATHLSTVLHEKGHNIIQVYSRSELSAKSLAETLKSQYTTSLKEITNNADIYFVAIKDSAFIEVLSEMNIENRLLVHCSGSLPIQILKNYSENCGVFYPLQTFSKYRNVDFKSIPIFIEANSTNNEEILFFLAQQISGTVNLADSEKRRTLHIAAVFASNFVNHFYTISGDILNLQQISFDVLKPLILETAMKVQELSPVNAQTGPAIRFDKNVIDVHLAELNKMGVYSELYKSISESIFAHRNKIIK